MNKVESGVIVTIVLAIISGAVYIGTLEGRVQAIELGQDFVHLETQKSLVLESIETAKNTAIAELDNTNTRITLLESSLNKERKASVLITLGVGTSGTWGEWRGAKHCPSNYYVCSLEQRTEPKQGNKDDTGVTGIRFQCCPL